MISIFVSLFYFENLIIANSAVNTSLTLAFMASGINNLVALSKACTQRKTPRKRGNSNGHFSSILIDQLVKQDATDWSASFMLCLARCQRISFCTSFGKGIYSTIALPKSGLLSLVQGHTLVFNCEWNEKAPQTLGIFNRLHMDIPSFVIQDCRIRDGEADDIALTRRHSRHKEEQRETDQVTTLLLSRDFADSSSRHFHVGEA
jgi:hypothetical protein